MPMMGGAPAGSSGTGTGPTANVYTPTAQPWADVQYQNILRDFMQAGAGPAGTWYPRATNVAQNQIFGNPFIPEMVRSAQLQAQLGVPAGREMVAGGQQLLGQMQPVLGAGRTIMNQGFDPQGALYNRMLGQQQQQMGAAAAMTGTQASPYSTGVMGQDLANFNIDWQNQQLGRMLQGQQGLNAAAQQAGNLLGAGGQGISQGLGVIGTAGAAPYQARLGVGQQDLQTMQGLTGLGNLQYWLPQQTQQDLQSYLQLGQAASQTSGYLGQLGFNQQMAGMQGLGELGMMGLGGNALLGNPIGNALGFGAAGGGGGLGGVADFSGSVAGAGGGDLLGLSSVAPGAAGLIPSAGGASAVTPWLAAPMLGS